MGRKSAYVNRSQGENTKKKTNCSSIFIYFGIWTFSTLIASSNSEVAVSTFISSAFVDDDETFKETVDFSMKFNQESNNNLHFNNEKIRIKRNAEPVRTSSGPGKSKKN